ncbi:MFS transporter [Jeotgalibacillus sp. ET6]|uniref:MFS transporter n=1 Tax=Jeotgalibacillus sp. ET6 TaxID=3037260 RepID=UPI0024189CBA|nr:MFS transporter [Jeotgalibacillus sp. ET6]MDG5471128.1 MFS transporter [Jeotgalibacillus sp. ET6]
MTETQRIKRATRNLYLFTGSEFVGTIGAHIYMFGIGLFVLGLTGSASSFALTMLCSMIPRIIFSPIAGHILDRLPKKPVVVASHALMTVTMAIVFIYTLLNGLSLPVIYFTSAFLSVFATFSGIGLTAAIANFIDEPRIQRAVSLTQSSTSLASILGPILGGVMYGYFSIEVFLLCHAVAYGVVAILEANIHFTLFKKPAAEKENASLTTNQSMFSSIKDGAVYVKNHHVLFSIMTVALWVNFFFMAMTVGLPFIIIEVLQASSQQLGLIEAMLGVGTLLTSVFIATRPEFKKPIRTIRGGLLSLGIIFALIAVPLLISMPDFGFVGFYMATGFMMGLLMVMINTPIMVILQKTTPESYRGRVFGLLEMLATGISPIGLVLYGFLYDVVSPQWIILASAGMLFSVTLYGLRGSRVKDEPLPAKKDPALQEVSESLSS